MKISQVNVIGGTEAENAYLKSLFTPPKGRRL